MPSTYAIRKMEAGINKSISTGNVSLSLWPVAAKRFSFHK
jgi:hypothetical protein